MEILPERVTWIALYNTVTSKENPCLWPCSMIYSGYSTHAVMMQYGNADITLDIIRGIDTIRTGTCALLWGTLRKWMFPCPDAINRNGWFRIELYL